MESEWSNCKLLMRQTIDLAEQLNINVIVGIELSSLGRCWSSNCDSFQTHLKNRLASDDDFWLTSREWFDEVDDVHLKEPLYISGSDSEEIGYPEDKNGVDNSRSFTKSLQLKVEPIFSPLKEEPYFDHQEESPDYVVKEENAANDKDGDYTELWENTGAASKHGLSGDGDIESPERCSKCLECGQLIPMLHMEMHVMTVHQDKRSLVCPTCGRGFHKKLLLKRHLNTCDPRKKPFLKKIEPCSYCRKTFTSFVERQEHLKKHLTCPHCNKMYAFVKLLEQHIALTHEKQKTWACSKCGRKFGTKTTLACHEKSVHQKQERSCICSLCGKGFFNKAQLKAHGLVHDPPEKTHACDQCPKIFSRKEALKMHVKGVHLKERSVSCGDCGRGFFSTSELTTHKMFKHGGERKFSCSMCQKMFFTKPHLKRHEKTHLGKPDFQKVDSTSRVPHLVYIGNLHLTS